jgi:hypothetical protein
MNPCKGHHGHYLKIAELALKTTITHSFNNTEFQVSRHMTGNSCHVKLFCMVQAAINLGVLDTTLCDKFCQ